MHCSVGWPTIRTIGTVTQVTSGFDALLSPVLPYLNERAGDTVDVGVEGDKLTVTWSDGELSADRYALAASRTSMRRLGAGQSPDDNEHLLFWTFLSDADGESIWSGRVLEPAALVGVIHRWLHPPTLTPVTFTPEDLAEPPARQGELHIEIPTPLPGVELLSVEDATSLDEVIATVDTAVLAEYWPRDAKGATRTADHGDPRRVRHAEHHEEAAVSGPRQRHVEGRHGDRFRDQGVRRQFTVQLVRAS